MIERPSFLSDPALLRLWDVLPQSRVVGGAVRDAIAKVLVADIDLATPDQPDAVMAALKAAGLRGLPTGIAHGTVTALVDGRPFEVTTLRRDIATDGRHATVAFTADFQADAARRDFTVNAMSLDRDGTLHDYFGGSADLAAGRVQFVGDPATRIAEDFLRVLRFFRFYARYGTEHPDATTTDALRAGAAGLRILSPERVWSEIKRILLAPDPVASLRLATELGVLEAVLPGADGVDRLAALIAAGAPADPLLRLAALTAEDADTLADRWRLSNPERDTLVGLRHAAPATDPASLRRTLADATASLVAGRLWLAGADPAVIARFPEPPIFPVQGRDLIAAGATPGPALGQQLARLRAAWLDGHCVADKRQLIDLWQSGLNLS